MQDRKCRIGYRAGHEGVRQDRGEGGIGLERCKTGGLKDKRNEGQKDSRTGRNQDRKDPGQKGSRTGMMQHWGIQDRVMQDRRDALQE